jgi:succinoglycan biosynthesis protein ExoM
MPIDHISVCICTFKRPDLLARLLDSLATQVRDESFTFDIVVVDNDKECSSQGVVRRVLAARTGLSLTYECEPDQNISLARNRAIRNATGNLVALIDDDEWPVPEWLSVLHRAWRQNTVHGILGPVLPVIPPDAPRWLKRGRFFQRDRHPTGTEISHKDARTGNLLVSRSVFVDDGFWFDPAFGRTGGEDGDFFTRHFKAGGRYLWCDEAVAYEAVPPERWKSSYQVKRWLVSGTVAGERMRSGSLPAKGMITRNLLILSLCSILAPPSVILPKHLRIRVLQKLAYCGGLVSAYYGLSLLRYRY